MKKTFAKRISSLLIATTMMFGTVISTSAEEVECSNVGNEYNIAQSEYEVSPLADSGIMWEGVQSGEKVTGTITLDHYIGFTKTINAAIIPFKYDGVITGKVHVLVKRVSDNETIAAFSLDPNGEWVKSKQLTLPKSGDYEVIALNDMNIGSLVHVYWS